MLSRVHNFLKIYHSGKISNYEQLLFFTTLAEYTHTNLVEWDVLDKRLALNLRDKIVLFLFVWHAIFKIVVQLKGGTILIALNEIPNTWLLHYFFVKFG